jgi:hypothetical protein
VTTGAGLVDALHVGGPAGELHCGWVLGGRAVQDKFDEEMLATRAER